MKRIIVLPSFEKSVRHLNSQEKKLLVKSLEAFNEYLTSHHAPFGFRLKKIDHDKYEFRVDLRLRIILKSEGDVYYLVLAGSHEDVLRHLKNF